MSELVLVLKLVVKLEGMLVVRSVEEWVMEWELWLAEGWVNELVWMLGAESGLELALGLLQNHQ
jgi:hypothetical protein